MRRVEIVLWLLGVQGLLGAFDTLYFHEWRARLPSLQRAARSELSLHAARDFVYVPLFLALPNIAWQGWWAVALACLLLFELILTLWDFVIEDVVRRPLGGVYAGERITHALMGILYGGMLANLFPVMLRWFLAPTALVLYAPAVPAGLSWALTLLGIGVFASGVRDLAAAYALPYSHWPWRIVPRD
jgi:hypothetical protein